MTSTIQKFPNGKFYINVATGTAKKLLASGDKRWICQIGEHRFHCAILNNKEKGYYVYLDTGWVRKQQLKTGMMIKASFTKDDTKHQFMVPEEWTEVMNTDVAAAAVFHQLSPGNQRSLLYLVNQPKSSDKKIERALKIAARLKAGICSPLEVLK